ncbi:MAG: single-stranded DNA-binding protein [Flavobacteriia bacterium]|nr:single-stranded DNA-binding protein [Flavobacteriia bacterium]
MSTIRNKVNLIGRVGQAPEVQTVKGDYKVVKVSLATNEPHKGKDGKWVDNTQWHSLIFWGKTAENFARIAEKGSEVALEGKLVHNNYETKTGEKRFSTDIEVVDFLVLNNKKEK